MGACVAGWLRGGVVMKGWMDDAMLAYGCYIGSAINYHRRKQRKDRERVCCCVRGKQASERAACNAIDGSTCITNNSAGFFGFFFSFLFCVIFLFLLLLFSLPSLGRAPSRAHGLRHNFGYLSSTQGGSDSGSGDDGSGERGRRRGGSKSLLSFVFSPFRQLG